jgi:prepilin-type N-terminal cleavage/methylation domain-containing protein
MQKKLGFTLIELMLAAILGAIVVSALAAPMISMLRLNLRSRAIADLQGSMQVTSYRLHDEIRSGYVGYANTSITNGTLTIKQPGQTVAFYTNTAHTLIFDPNTKTDDDEIEVLENVTQFTVTKPYYPTYHVYITLAAEEPSFSHEIATEISATGRNQQ